jgi:hypothetical protein
MLGLVRNTVFRKALSIANIAQYQGQNGNYNNTSKYVSKSNELLLKNNVSRYKGDNNSVKM